MTTTPGELGKAGYGPERAHGEHACEYTLELASLRAVLREYGRSFPSLLTNRAGRLNATSGPRWRLTLAVSASLPHENRYAR